MKPNHSKKDNEYLLYRQFCQGKSASVEKLCRLVLDFSKKQIKGNAVKMEAEDLSQEVLMVLYNKCGVFSFEGQNFLEAMIRRIARLLILKKIKKDGRDELTQAELLEYNGEKILDEEETAKRELIIKMWKFINELPPKGQKLIKLYYFEGCNHQEIAAKLGLKNAETAKVMKSRYMKMLKELFFKNRSSK